MTEFKRTPKDLLLTDRLFMESPDHISILGRDYRYRRVNTAYEQAHRKTSEELIGKSVVDVLGQDTFEHIVKPRLDRCFEGEETHYEAWFTFANDQRHYMKVSYLPLTKDNQPIEEIVVMSRDFTDRKKIEDALKTSEDQYRDLYESAPLAYFSANFDGQIIRVNRRATDLLGYSQNELIGKHVFTLYSPTPEGIEKSLVIQQKSQQGIAVYDEEVEMIRKDGHTLSVSLTIRLIYDESGHLIERRGMAQDISSRKRIENELRASEYRFRSLVETTGCVIIGLTPEGWIAEWNREAEHLYGKAREEVLDKNYFEMCLQESTRLPTKQAIKEVFKGTPSLDLQSTIVDSNGSTRQILWKIDRLLSENNQPYGVICVGRDITQWKEAKEALQRQALMLDTLYDGVVITNLNGIITDWNPGAEHMFGYSRQEILGHTPDMLHHPSERSTLPQRIIDEITQNGRWQGEMRFIRKDGSSGTSETIVTPLKNPDGQHLGTIEVNRDITERRHLENQIVNIVKGVSGATGGEFFRSFVKHLSSALNVDYAFVGHVVDKEIPTIRTMAFFGKGEHLDNFEKNLRHTPCEKVLHQGYTAYLNHVAQEFPKDMRLQLRGIQGYAGLPLYDTNGQVLGLIVVLREQPLSNLESIESTMKIFAARAEAELERTRTEEALRETEQRFRTYFETGLVGMAITSLDTGWLEVNDRLCHMLGYSREELQKTTWAKLTHPDDLLQDENHFTQLLSGTLTSYSVEKRFIRKDSSVIVTNLYVNAVRKSPEHVEYITVMLEDITEQKQAEASLQKWATIFQHTQWGVAVGNANSPNLDLVNEAYARMHGYTVQELQGQPIARVFAPEFRSQLPGFINKIHEVGFQSIESRHIRKDGTTFPALLTVSAIKDAQGIVLYRVANVIDISDLKQTQQALIESQHIYQELVQTIDGIVWECDFPSMQVTFVSQFAEHFLGYPLADWKKDPEFLLKIIHPHDRQRIAKECGEASWQKDNHVMEYRAMHAKGSTLWIKDHVSVVVKDEQPVKLRGIMVDITQNKQAEEALQESEKRFRIMFEQAAVGVAQIDSNTGAFIRINQRYCDIVGFTQEEMVSKTFQDITHEDDLQANLDNMSKLYAGKIQTFSMEKRYVRKNRMIVWVHLTISPMWQPGEAPSFHIAVAEEITERKKLEKAVQQQNEELEKQVEQRTARIQELEQRRMQVEKLAALAQIAAGVAHEINNPLASISQSLVLLKRAIPEEHPHFRYMAKTEDCIARIATITKRLYQLYRPSNPIPTPVDIRTCLRIAMEIMEDRAWKYKIQIRIPSLSQPIICQIPQGELIQVLCNLLHNAIDASASETTIEINLVPGPQTLSIVVTDHGEGISADAAPHIFEPFFTTKHHQAEGGMGLGLSISHSLIESMGGTLDFSSSIGQGSTFTITLPMT